MTSQANTSGFVSNGDDGGLSRLIDDLQLVTGLRYLKTEIGDETRGGSRHQYPSPLINSSSCQYRLINEASTTLDTDKDEVDETTGDEYNSDAATDATSDVGNETAKKAINFNNLAPELRNKIYTYYAQDTDNIPAGSIEIGITINGQYIHPRRDSTFNLNIFLVCRSMGNEALPIIKAELATRRFILIDYDGGVLQSRIEQDMLPIFGDCMQTVTVHGGAMMNIRVDYEFEDDWTRELVEIALQESGNDFVQIFVDNTIGVPRILSSYAGAVAAYPKNFVPEREWQVRYVMPMSLEVEEGDDPFAWKFTVWLDGDLGGVVKFERK